MEVLHDWLEESLPHSIKEKAWANQVDLLGVKINLLNKWLITWTLSRKISLLQRNPMKIAQASRVPRLPNNWIGNGDSRCQLWAHVHIAPRNVLPQKDTILIATISRKIWRNNKKTLRMGLGRTRNPSIHQSIRSNHTNLQNHSKRWSNRPLKIRRSRVWRKDWWWQLVRLPMVLTPYSFSSNSSTSYAREKKKSSFWKFRKGKKSNNWDERPPSK